MYKAVFIDIDGTLTRSDHTVSPASIQTIKKLKENNILVVLISARPLHGIIQIAEETGIAGFPIASLNGACISRKGKMIFESKIDLTITKGIYEQVKQYDATTIYYDQSEWFAELQNFHTDFEQEITTVPIAIKSFQQIMQDWKEKNNGPHKILIISSDTVINEIQINLQQLYSRELNIQTSKSTYLEIINHEASKLNAIKFLINLYGIEQQETIAIGDNFNDKEMIEFAGTGIAMGNAPDEVKYVADYVADTNDDDGVAKALARFFDFLSSD